MGCVLRAIGSEFDPDSFLAASTLQGASVFRKGDPLGPGARSASGFSLSVSGAGVDRLADQIQDTIAFLDLHEDEIRRLAAFPGVEQVFLDFGIPWQPLPAQSEILPADLLWKLGALDLDLVLTHHLAAERES